MSPNQKDQNTDSLASEICINQKQFICDICQKDFFTEIHYQVHLIIHLLPEHLNCHDCQKGFTHILSLNKHLEMHTNLMSIVCHMCKKEFFDADSRNKHAKEHHSESLKACVIRLFACILILQLIIIIIN